MGKFKVDTLVIYEGEVYAVIQSDDIGVVIVNKHRYCDIGCLTKCFKRIKPLVFPKEFQSISFDWEQYSLLTTKLKQYVQV